MTSSETPLALRVSSSAVVLDADRARGQAIIAHLKGSRIAATLCEEPSMALVSIYSDPPDLLLVHEAYPPQGGLALARQIKSDNVFAQLPILLVAPGAELGAILADGRYPFDDFIAEEALPGEFAARAELCVLRTRRQLDANPLTRLPGNNSIAHELESRLSGDAAFAVCYVDLDNFKAFNDRYGFSRGDEALRMAARLLVYCVEETSRLDRFVGHVGGDDFLFVVPSERAEDCCRRVTENFDQIMPTLYDEIDRRNGCISSTNRRGEKETFPLMTVSLAVVLARPGEIEHRGEISAVAAELKKEIKRREGSGWLVDRRRSGGG